MKTNIIKKKISTLLFCIISILILKSCAQIGTPSGGTKDKNPPKYVKSKPDNYSINFDDNEIYIYFDEYITLKNTKDILCSPITKFKVYPKQGQPNDYINIKITDTLEENMTYSFNFRNIIQDYNEGNKLEEINFVFSTGDFIDSLYIKGVVLDGYYSKTQDDKNNILAMLYNIDSSFTDSTIYKQKPLYVKRIKLKDTFKLNNLKNKKYLLISLEDTDKDMKYNPEKDQIAFVKEFINIPNDTSKIFQLELFKENLQPKAINAIHKKFGMISISSKGDIDKINIERVFDKKNKADSSKKVIFKNYKEKSIEYWYNPKSEKKIKFVAMNKDTLITSIKKFKKDSTISIQSSISSSFNPKYDTLYLLSTSPMEAVDSSKMYMEEDSLKLKFNFSKVNPKKIMIDFQVKNNKLYSLTILPKAIRNFFGVENKDTINIKFDVKKESFFGNIFIKLKNVKSFPIVLELSNSNKKIPIFAKTNKLFKFENITPGDYNLKIIYDNNGNKKWDTGNFLKKIQPEKVIKFDKTIKLKSNRDIEEEWDLNKKISKLK